MFDGKGMYPRGFHPTVPQWKPSLRGEAKALRHNQVPRVKYYFIDWELSVHFAEPNKDKLVDDQAGADRDVPELSLYTPYNPFPVDVFTLGNVFKKEFVNVRIF